MLDQNDLVAPLAVDHLVDDLPCEEETEAPGPKAELGAFLLAGKSKPVVVHELLGRQADATSRERDLCAAFAEALAAYRDGSWKEACELFRECTRAHGEDGPSRFYERLCEQYAEVPPGDPWDPVIRMDRK